MAKVRDCSLVFCYFYFIASFVPFFVALYSPMYVWDLSGHYHRFYCYTPSPDKHCCPVLGPSAPVILAFVSLAVIFRFTAFFTLMPQVF